MRSRIAAALTLCIALGMAAPSFAADAKTTHTTRSTSTSSTSLDNLSLETAVNGALIPTRLAGAGVGAVVGVPIAAARETHKAYFKWTPDVADKIGGHEFGPAMGLATLATLPASLVWGAASGTYFGARNGVYHGFNAPFHPDSFSLGKDFEE